MRDGTGRAPSPSLLGSCSIRPAIKPFGGLHRNILRLLLSSPQRRGANSTSGFRRLPTTRRRRLFPVRCPTRFLPPPLLLRRGLACSGAFPPRSSWAPGCPPARRVPRGVRSSCFLRSGGGAAPWNLTGSSSGDEGSGLFKEGERQMWRQFNDLWDVLGSGFLSSRFL